MNVTFRTGILSGIFDIDQNHEVHIIPHVMNFPYVIFKGHVFVVERFTIQS